MFNTSSKGPDFSGQEHSASHIIWSIFPPILLCFGTVGNVLSIIVLSRRKLYKTSQSFLLISLSIADLAVLYTGLLSTWLVRLTAADVSSFSLVLCKVSPWVVYSTADISVWMLVCISLERMLSTILPWTFRNVCSKRKIQLAVASCVVLAMIVNSHFIVGMDSGPVGQLSHVNNTAKQHCGPMNEEYRVFLDTIWPVIDLMKFCIVPFLILLVSTVCILRKLCQSRSKVASQQNQHARYNSNNDFVSGMSKLLVLLNLVFITCTAPIGIYILLNSQTSPEVQHQIMKDDPVWAMVNILLYMNNSGNFLLYCVSGSRFRRELVTLFQRRSHLSQVHPLQENPA